MYGYLFDTQEAAQQVLDGLAELMVANAVKYGMSVTPDGKGVYCKRFNGVDAPHVARKFADPEQLRDGRWFFPSLRRTFTADYSALEQAFSLEYVDIDPALSLED